VVGGEVLVVVVAEAVPGVAECDGDGEELLSAGPVLATAA
jgi:hypothetical protein